MVFDPSKDKVLKQWECEETGLIISINRYGNGDAKVQIGPRTIKKRDGETTTLGKAGRLNTEDILWLYTIIDEVKEAMVAEQPIE